MRTGATGGRVVLMVWPFGRPASPVRRFETAKAFFEDQCRRGPAAIVQGEGRVALVLDARVEINAPMAIQVDEGGVQTAMLLVASRDGGFIVAARTPSGAGEPLNPGDLVFWEPVALNDALSAAAVDARSGLMGVIRGKLRAELAADGDLSVQSFYD